jgi:hypothetical protein
MLQVAVPPELPPELVEAPLLDPPALPLLDPPPLLDPVPPLLELVPPVLDWLMIPLPEPLLLVLPLPESSSVSSGG